MITDTKVTYSLHNRYKSTSKLIHNCHKKYEKTGFNADFNAARNIAMSTLWMENGQVTEKSKQEAREYYGISEKYEQSKNDLENNKVA